MVSATLIAIDWGTTAFRAYLLNQQGAILQTQSGSKGILKVSENHFEQALEEQIGPWMDQFPGIPMIACGMIGSRQGWQEIPYLTEPIGLQELAESLGKVALKRGTSFWIVPGLQVFDAYQIPDVMRGEETQVLGSVGEEKALFVLPGTHSKWVFCEQGKIVQFSTFMTGEVYQILKEHSILGKLFAEDLADRDAFAQGVNNAQLNQFSGLLHNLFSARTLGLTDQFTATQLPSYLSGLLIGSELREAKTWMAHQSFSIEGEVKLLGDSNLVQRYQTALEKLWGWQSTILAENLVVQGLYKIAVHAGIVK